ncbi:class I SAM-dependent methyltransferase [Streptomyces griseus]|uniref:class I SAM-dependent methyltransferase n=1 Tax=Streptomyces griseus TaxID=1911 RepID=UPI0033FC01E8
MTTETAGLMPPAHLRARVTGVEDEAMFQFFGHRIASEIQALFDNNRLPFGTPGQTIVDFGCGCARVLRHVIPQKPQARYYGVDVDAQAIEWCRNNLADRAEFAVTERLPPLPFDDATVDVVYGVSVFSHIPEGDQQTWLAEFSRILTPGGILLLSVNGATVARMATKPVREKLEQDGIAYVRDGGISGLPDWYQMCFHTRHHIERSWPTAGLRLETYTECAVMMCQDAVLLRKTGEHLEGVR